MAEDIIKKKRQNNEKSLANLKPIQKGEVRNPNGRPKKGFCLIECIKDELEKKPFESSPLTNEQLISAALVKMASQGNTKAIDLLMSYTTPKPNQGVIPNGITELTVKWDGNGAVQPSVQPENVIPDSSDVEPK